MVNCATVGPGGAPEDSLFERLGQPGAAPADLGNGGFSRVVVSIKRHLVCLLNSRPGNSTSAPALGLVDFNDATLGTEELSMQLCSAIRQCIERFEPRVNRVEVKPQPPGWDPLQLRFQVTVYLNLPAVEGKTTIDLMMDDKRYCRLV
ncbi:type VI secretion system baseplate subunit TssE [Marinobacter sp. X15-166B]|uniref:type VI secretion system baseplate subunit TssE n=1 Tax=Marinobacter sp. X15-166B TaxID=1897620 RepID=UPI00085CD70E|nr:type VI secretion system baseplate subunit TssE [Marinobacter sp. X15-166B]OEY65829.1 type VI secretion protein [Marinobacter sp. X15-166B]